LALDTAHKEGVIHRDVKPANIMVREDDQAAITDFGLSRQERKRSITQAGALMGTPVYMAPEQARGEKVDHRIDVYALGATLYECLTGQVPFTQTKLRKLLVAITSEPPKPPSEVRPGISTDLEAITLKALSKKPEDRYQTAKEMADDLIRYFRGDIVNARSVGRVEIALRQAVKHKLITGLSLAVVLLVMGWVVGNPYLIRQRAQARAQLRFAEAHNLVDQPLAAYRRARDELAKAREARDATLHKVGAAGKEQGQAARGAVTRATLAFTRAEELLLTPQGSAERAVAERGRDLLDEVRVLIPEGDPLADEVRALLRDLVQAQLDSAERKGNVPLARVRRGELGTLGESATEVEGTATLVVETVPPNATVFLYRVEEDERQDWILSEARDVGQTPLEIARQLDEGEYLVELLCQGRVTVRVPLVVRAGQDTKQIRLELPPAERVPPGFTYIPPSEFRAGGDADAVRPLFRAPQPIWVGGFFLGTHEVSVAEYLEYLNAQPEDRRRVPNAWQFQTGAQRKVVAPREALDHPVAGVSRADAEAYCEWLTARDGERTYRLPTSVEWEKAARGSAGRPFPWGQRFDLADPTPRSHMQKGGPPGRISTVPRGSISGDRSIYGVMDMGGNLSEWVSDSFGGNSDDVLRGGSWARAPEVTRSASREAVNPLALQSVADRVGFRIAFD
jgi:formylglycine-generating enzyme required for sulfatase activity